MSHDNSRRHRKSRSLKKKDVPVAGNFPSVTFEGAESVEIPADDGKSPVSTHLSLVSNPSDFKFMDEIALLKRGRIDKDAPKHPYNRRGQDRPKEKTAMTPVDSSSHGSLLAPISPLVTLMHGKVEEEKLYKVGQDGQLKYGRMTNGGERYELKTTDENPFVVYQQNEGQTCLFTFRL